MAMGWEREHTKDSDTTPGTSLTIIWSHALRKEEPHEPTPTMHSFGAAPARHGKEHWPTHG